MSGGISIRAAIPADLDTVVRYIRELARYEKLEHLVTATPELIQKALFSPEPKAHAVICEEGRRPIGFGLFVYNFSTFLGRPGIYLEDLYVEPEFRRGLGGVPLPRPARRERGLRARRMVGARLERAGDQVLPRHGRPADERLVRHAAHRRRAHQIGGIRGHRG